MRQAEDPTRAQEFDSALGPAGEDVFYAVHRRGERDPEYRERRVLDRAAYLARLRQECATNGAVVEELAEAEYRERSSSARRLREALRVVARYDAKIAENEASDPTMSTVNMLVEDYAALRALVKR
jgi:hypothetical protein